MQLRGDAALIFSENRYGLNTTGENDSDEIPTDHRLR
jgi:hypothetical protein